MAKAGNRSHVETADYLFANLTAMFERPLDGWWTTQASFVNGLRQLGYHVRCMKGDWAKGPSRDATII